jgi:hypothetical protein
MAPASAAFLRGLLFDTEDEGDMFLRTTWPYNSEECALRNKLVMNYQYCITVRKTTPVTNTGIFQVPVLIQSTSLSQN